MLAADAVHIGEEKMQKWTVLPCSEVAITDPLWSEDQNHFAGNVFLFSQPKLGR